MTLSVCDKSDNDKRVREEAAVDSGAVECDEQEETATRQSRRHARIKTRRHMDMRKRKRDQERRHGDNQLEDWAWHCEEMSIQSWTSVENIDPCGQTSGNRS